VVLTIAIVMLVDSPTLRDSMANDLFNATHGPAITSLRTLLLFWVPYQLVMM